MSENITNTIDEKEIALFEAQKLIKKTTIAAKKISNNIESINNLDKTSTDSLQQIFVARNNLYHLVEKLRILVDKLNIRDERYAVCKNGKIVKQT